MTINVNTRPAAARAFVRSLNILLKFARMYDFGHPRTVKQYDTAWSELCAALGPDNEAGLLLAVSGDQLLLDGTPLDAAPSEKSFARMLSGSGIASIHFSPNVTQASLARFVKGFPTNTSSKPVQLAEQLKAALHGDPNIHVNEVCFVLADSAVAKGTIAAQLVARTLGMNSEQTDQLFNDPEKLLQLIVAAEGAKASGDHSPTGTGGAGGGPGGAGGGPGGAGGGPGGAGGGPGGAGGGPGGPGGGPGGAGGGLGGAGGGLGGLGAGPGGAGGTEGQPGADRATIGSLSGHGDSTVASRWANATAEIRSSRSGRGGPGSMAIETGLMTLHENELKGILQVLGQIAHTGEGAKRNFDSSAFQSRLSTLPRRARFTVSQALSAMAAQVPSESSDKPTLLKLAEHIAVRFALERYERGDVKVSAVGQMLTEMSQELEGLRKILGAYEDQMTRAGLEIPSHVDSLAREFWSQVPEAKKRTVLESGDVWCVPGPKVREYVEGLLSRGETEAAEKILRNYANCVTSESNDVRRHAAMGLAELAPLYANGEEKLLIDTIRQVGVQLAEERDSELQSLVGAAFVRLSQEATKKRSYRAIQRVVELVDYIESVRPGVGRNVRPRISVESRLPEFIEESLRTGAIPPGLKDLLRRMPQAAAEQIAARFGRVGLRQDCEILVSMLQLLGPEGVEHLRGQLRLGGPIEAVDTVGILTRVDFETLAQVLPERLKEWTRTAHDRVVRQIATSASPDRGRLLLELFGYLDSLIRPMAVDEIGMCGDHLADMHLLRLAEGDLPSGATDYLRLKAIEALGRLRSPGAEMVLKKVAEMRKTWRWANPSELRLVAVQALVKIDPEWVRNFLPRSGLNIAEFSIEALDCDPNSSAIRQRRYARLRLEHPLTATTTNLRENCRIEIPELTLGGGVAICEQSLHPGSLVDLRLNTGQKPVKAQAIVRNANAQARAFEVVDIDLEERAKLRRLLLQYGNAQKQSTPEERSRRSTGAVITFRG
jgi:hypothetical protein